MRDISNILNYRNYLLFILVLAGVVTTFERFLFSLALQPIKLEMQLSDSQLGLMTGIAFAGFYAIAGLPIARWADRGNRVTITTISVGFLGAMVSLCGVVGNFYQLLLVRAGVAVGEAGLVPAAQSLLPDYFNRAERPYVMAIFFSFYSISMIFGYFLGGRLIEFYGWRSSFIMMGLPALVMALIVKYTLKEPRLNRTKPKEVTCLPPSLIHTLKTVWQQRTFRQLLLSFCAAYFFGMGVNQWLAVFLIRTYEMTLIDVGAWLALAVGVFGTLGNYLGGYYASRFLAKKEKRQMRTLSCVIVLYGVASVFIYLSPNKYSAIVFIAISAALGSVGNGPLFAAMQSLVDEKMRSTSVAITFMLANLVGFGIAPLAVGVISDLLYPIFDQDSLRYALVAFCPGTLWIAFHYWKAGETIQEDIRLIEMKGYSAIVNSDSSVPKNGVSQPSFSVRR